jgi:hypothetical protein
LNELEAIEHELAHIASGCEEYSWAAIDFTGTETD